MGMPTDIGIVDLGIGFPYQSIEEKKAAYDFFRPTLKDRQSLEEFEFPAQYMFKDVPDVVDARRRRVQWIVDKMDEFDIEQAMTGLSAERHPGQAPSTPAGSTCSCAPTRTRAWTRCARSEQPKAEHDIVSAMTLPVGQVPAGRRRTTRRCTRST